MEKKTLPMHKLLDAMTKYESDEWSKADYIHMLKHMVKLLELDETSAIKMAFLDGKDKGRRESDDKLLNVDDLLLEMDNYVSDNFKLTSDETH